MILSSLRNRIFLTSALLAVLSIGAAIYLVSVRVTRELEESLQHEIHSTGQLVEQLRNTRAQMFAMSARLIADAPTLKAAVDTNDPATVQNNATIYQNQLNSNLLLVTNKTGDVLATVGRPEDGPELARYLEDPERSVQRVAIDGVKRTGYTAAVPALAQLVLARDGKPASPRTRLATEAATAMKVLSGQRGAAALTGYFSSQDPRVREAACIAFTLFTNPGTKQARPALERLLVDGDPRVVRAARRALAPR